LHDLAAVADVLLVGGSPRSIEERGLTYERLCRVNPRLVVTTIMPFGMTGPRRDWAATELIEVAAGCWLFVSPGALADASLPPLKAFGQQGIFKAECKAPSRHSGRFVRAAARDGASTSTSTCRR
jgi:crotonobetainyl-CoA:carnitine CoA-transferase CaiB-like acyl-CoA transferase